jgi:peptidoglycan/LPS O-acetylase OafA/YrhL
LRQALLIGADGDFYLDHVLWTLVHELRFSLLLPFAIAFTIRWDPRGRTLLLIAGSVMFGVAIGDQFSNEAPNGVPVGTMHSLTYLALPAMIFVWLALRTRLFQALFPDVRGATSMQWPLLGGAR